MGFLKDITKAAINPVGAIGNAIGVDSKYTNLIDPMGGIRGSLFGKITGDGKVDPNAGIGASNAQTMEDSRQRSKDKQLRFYGSSLDNLGAESTDYANRTKANLDKNVARADIYNQQAGQQRALDNARAGLSGVDTSALNEQGRRNASFGAAAINEDAKRQALDLYGQSISNRITGANTIDTQEQALGIASLQQPVAQAGSGGILSSIFGGLF